MSSRHPCLVYNGSNRVYYENLAYFLTENKFSVSVFALIKVKNFSKTLENKSKTDDIDAAIQTQYGLEKTLKAWTPPSGIFRELKSLQENTGQSKNQLQ
ncbi:MAG: transposase [Ignavibacteria bacterium]|nr:transposase [Ignavibacteria bacterium]